MTTPPEWPLSVAATAVLCGLHDEGYRGLQRTVLARLVVKELFWRGELQVVEFKRRPLDASRLIVAVTPTGRPLPTPLPLLAARLPQAGPLPFARVMRLATKQSGLPFIEELGNAIDDDLLLRGLAEPRQKKTLRVFSSEYYAPTEFGRRCQAAAVVQLEAAEQLPALARDDPRRARELAGQLGVLAALAPNGFTALLQLTGSLNGFPVTDPETAKALNRGIDSGVSKGKADGGEGGSVYLSEQLATIAR